MIYDPDKSYTQDDFREFSPVDLRVLFGEAKKTALMVGDTKLVKKIGKDISNMRLLFNGFDGIYNRKH